MIVATQDRAVAHSRRDPARHGGHVVRLALIVFLALTLCDCKQTVQVRHDLPIQEVK